MEQYLRSTDIINWEHPEVYKLAKSIRHNAENVLEMVRHCFEWVRDEIKHSYDYKMNPVTCTASEVLEYRTGFCYSKMHLLAALLRANHIPAGLCYQRLRRDEQSNRYCLHGLNAAYLADIGWYRMDPRGNKEGIDAQFDPPHEQLAFLPSQPGEADLNGVFSDPLECIVDVLKRYQSWEKIWNNLPDMVLINR